MEFIIPQVKKIPTRSKILVDYFISKMLYNAHLKNDYDTITTIVDMQKDLDNSIASPTFQEVDEKTFIETFAEKISPETYVLGLDHGPLYTMVLYLDFENEKIFSKVIKASDYHKYMMNGYIKSEELNKY